MEGLAGWIIVGFVAWWSYKSSKRTGSRKGYNVGRSRSKRNRRRD
ncbi:hypothetical protein Poly21_07900 [Allorhodopirellula heiligendammensis]|uniref:Uncharacterized protein n=1 Tax=Allorhodopirellula heiligendammensis TaxID=2714739 RepID=A0A5C6C590_9BACT|nr:hypothetical protein Poly21_07900 [Allorhodopirellula heiligendammensis]